MRQALRSTLIILVVTTLMAIPATAGSLEKGVKAGMNISNLGGRDVRVSEQRIGFVAGGYATYLFYGYFAVQLEALYSQKGASAETTLLDSGSVSLRYLEFPLLMKVVYPIQRKKSDAPSYFDSKKGIRPSLYVGPAIGFSLKDEIEVDSTSAPLKTVDIGLAFGICLDFETGKGLFSFDARYTASLTDIPDVDGDVLIHNNGATLSVGYAFR